MFFTPSYYKHYYPHRVQGRQNRGKVRIYSKGKYNLEQKGCSGSVDGCFKVTVTQVDHFYSLCFMVLQVTPLALCTDALSNKKPGFQGRVFINLNASALDISFSTIRGGLSSFATTSV